MKNIFSKLHQMLLFAAFFYAVSCSPVQKLQHEIHDVNKKIHPTHTGMNIYNKVQSLQRLPVLEREKIIKQYMLDGNIPSFIMAYKKVDIAYSDISGKQYHATLFVSPDYLCMGNDTDYMRIPLTPQTAQEIADSLHAVLPTAKMVDEIYKAASVTLEPQPLTVARDSIQTFLHHHYMIETKLLHNKRKGIIAGIKKDVVQSNAVLNAGKKNRVAIYGWHRMKTQLPIQPLYVGHVDWYVDYSHGIRFVYEKMLLNNKIVRIKDVLNDPALRGILTYEENGGYMRYADE